MTRPSPPFRYALTRRSLTFAALFLQTVLGTGAAPRSGDAARVKEVLIRLKQLLETDDGEAADFIIDAQSSFVGVLTPIEMKMLSDSVGNFDFEAALNCLSGIALRLSAELEAMP